MTTFKLGDQVVIGSETQAVSLCRLGRLSIQVTERIC